MPDKKITLIAGRDGKPSALVLPRITDYFELPQIAALSKSIADAVDPTAEAKLFGGGIHVHAANLTTSQLLAAAVCMLEDLYAGMASGREASIPLPRGLESYLHATAGTLAGEIRRRGYRLQYVIDNQFPAGALGPAALFPLWFRASGFTYCSPFEAALMLMDADGIEIHAFDNFWPRYRAEGREIAYEAYVKAEANGRNIVVLDDEPGEALLTCALSNLPRAALIHMFRNAPSTVKGVRISAPAPVNTELDHIFES